jgi:hypothetical protein
MGAQSGYVCIATAFSDEASGAWAMINKPGIERHYLSSAGQRSSGSPTFRLGPVQRFARIAAPRNFGRDFFTPLPPGGRGARLPFPAHTAACT